MSTSGDSWYVKLSDGDVHRVTLDQLDEAFQAGHIDGNTMVLASGATQWTKLGALAGIDEDAGEIQADPPNPPIGTPAVPSAAPHGYAAQPGSNAPRSQAPQPTAWGAAAAPRRAPQAGSATAWGAGVQPASMPSRGSAGQSSYVPAQSHPATLMPARGAGPAALAPAVNGIQSTVATPYPQIRPIELGAPGRFPVVTAHPGISVVPGAPLPNSLRPISMDFEDLGDEALKLRRGSGKRWVAAALVLTVLGAAGVVSVRRPSWAQPYLSRIGLRGPSDSMAATSPPPPPVAPPLPPAPPPAVATPEPVPPTTAPAAAAGDSPLSPHFTDRNTDDSKLRAADTDKSKAKGHKARAAAGAARHAPAPKGKPNGFTTGGSKYDPLNSSI